jgi:hypothetical protein
LQLDLRIIYMTLRCVFKGQRLGKTAIAEAFAMRRTQHLAVPRFQTSVTREKLGADPALEATPARLLPDFAGTGDLSRSEERTALLAKPSTKRRTFLKAATGSLLLPQIASARIHRDVENVDPAKHQGGQDQCRAE